MVRIVKIFLFSVNFSEKSKPILGIAITDTYDNAVQELERHFQNIDELKLIDVVGWDELKYSIDIDHWPELYQNNEFGIFEENDFFNACQFLLSELSSFFGEKTKPIFNINLN